MFEQVKFRVSNPMLVSEGEEGLIYGGIGCYDDDGNLNYVICGCCGSVFDPEDVEILQKYNHWIDICEAIIGE